MTPESRATQLKALRSRSGLTLRDVADLLGLASPVSISRHERGKNIPSLLVALEYEVIFRISIAEQFPELFRTVEMAVEKRIAEFQVVLEQQDAKERGAGRTARKLEFLYERDDLSPD